MKRVLVVAPNGEYEREPSFRIRVLALREAMRRRGYEWEVRVRPKMPWGRWLFARSARGYDAVILHRKMLDPYEARVMRRGAKRILMDIDDATMYHEQALGGVARRRLEKRFEATAGIVDVVCAGNRYLGEIFEHQAMELRRRSPVIEVVPSVVVPERYVVKSHEETKSPRLVWIGSGSTLKYLEMAMEALGEAANRVRGLGLVVICDRAPAHATLPVEFVKWSESGEAGALAAGDIGIAPTPEDRWTLGKCGFKIVQYMAAGLPVVASPVGMNVELVGKEQCGLLPRRWEEWPGAIERLAKDVGLRRTMGSAGRKRVEEELCVERMADRWAGVLEGM